MKVYLEIVFIAISLAIDASVISMANGLNFPKIKKIKILFICFTFGVFQAIMPLMGYFLGHAVLSYIINYLSWISFFILLYLGVNMVLEGIKKEKQVAKKLTFFQILFQALASSVDAFSIGFTFSSYELKQVLQFILLIGSITSVLCFLGFKIGKRFGLKYGYTAELFGGIILILLGVKIFLI